MGIRAIAEITRLAPERNVTGSESRDARRKKRSAAQEAKRRLPTPEKKRSQERETEVSWPAAAVRAIAHEVQTRAPGRRKPTKKSRI
jgi:hypothetical protein